LEPNNLTARKFIPALTGIRAICVYLIFFKHLNFFSPESQHELYLLVNQFYTFLSFFFVLSGFMIYHRYYEAGGLKKTKLYNYFINRASRVFPILIILITLTFLLGYRDGLYNTKEAWKLYFLNITLLKGFSSEYMLTGIGPSWSMSVEELFYILSPFIFLFTGRTSSLIKFILITYTTGILITLMFAKIPFEGFFSSVFFTANFTFFGRVFEFGCGIFLAMLVNGKIKPIRSPLLEKYTLLIGLAIIISSVALLYLIASHFNVMQATETWQGILVNNILMPIGITILFYSLVYQKSSIQKFLSTKIMVQLGNATYSFYLLHTTFFLSYIFKYISHNTFIAFITMVIFSYLFHLTIEQPVTSFLRKILYRKN